MAEKKKVTANEIYDLLVNEFKIKEQIGIQFYLKNNLK